MSIIHIRSVKKFVLKMILGFDVCMYIYIYIKIFTTY